MKFFIWITGAALAASMGFMSLSQERADRTVEGAQVEPAAQYIVQASSAEVAQALILRVGGELISELAAIRAVSARLTDGQLKGVRRHEGVRVYADQPVKVSGRTPETFFGEWVGADVLHASGIDGRGVGVAVIDTGLWQKVAKEIDVSEGVSTEGLYTGGEPISFDGEQVADDSGHGTHVTSVIAGRELSPSGAYEGVAPGADVYVVKAFDSNGEASYIDVLEGIQWVLDQRERLNIRVLNLSFSAEALSAYWDDPLNQAVMRAWQDGLVVVTSAGNTGPEPFSVGVPGNVPYVVTVGSVDDNYTPEDHTDDFVSSFSASGPTYEGFVKPEMVAPGGHITAHMNPNGELAKNYSEYMDRQGLYFTMSGTSQSAAVVSGVAALLLQAEPGLTPDEVKCRLINASKPVVTETGELLYSFFQQGAGVIYAPHAVYSAMSGCANRGLNIARDLAGEEHYLGPAAQDEDGEFFLRDPQTGEAVDQDGSRWDGLYSLVGGYTWGGAGSGGTTADGYTWGGAGSGGTTADGYTWGGAGSGGTTADGYTWGGAGSGGTTADGYTWGGAGSGGTTADGYTWGGAGSGGTTADGYTWGGAGSGGTTVDGYTWGGAGSGGTTLDSLLPELDTIDLQVNRWVYPDPPQVNGKGGKPE
ncbi:alkaline serine protease [Abyssibacter profundi]|uniref:Alkaline serine protease n=2 Tax=Abyssibacter profundi TaxID=2182787 RepID=A0A363UJ49_9GAMM|nr:alkaline serine protease [Abyssibacter profundi]